METVVQKNEINYLYGIETASIVEAVEMKWTCFDRTDLIKLDNSLEAILQKERISVTSIERNKDPKYFEKVLNIDLPREYNKIKNHKAFPIRDFYLGYSRKSDEILLLDSCVEFILKKDHEHFNQFFAFRLATLHPTEIEPFLNYQFKKSFDNDIQLFRMSFSYMLADFSTVLKEKKKEIEALFNVMFSIAIVIKDQREPATISTEIIDHFGNESPLKEIFFPDAIKYFIEIEERLVADDYFDKNKKWKKTLIELVSMILLLETKKYFRQNRKKKANTNRIPYRIFFEKRYKVGIAKQMQPSQIHHYKLPDTHRFQFEFIPNLESKK